MYTIFTTEKPSVAQEYRKVLKVTPKEKTDGFIYGHSPVLNKDVIITWAIGHLINIASPEGQNADWGGSFDRNNLPMIPTNFKYVPNDSTINQFKVVSKLYTRSDIETIYYAGDSGREGIYIQALIRNQIFKGKKPNTTEKVVWINSFTEDEILRGIREAKPYNDYQSMIDSGYMRAISDWLIGMNFTEAFTLTCGKLINTGRVMTPTLAMVVNRQNEIENFNVTYYYGIKALDNVFFKAKKNSNYYDSENDLYNADGFLREEKANELINEFNKDKRLIVREVKKQQKTEYAPYLFNLADLQSYCSKYLKITPAKTLEIVQELYEQKLTTYPRTDSRFLSTAAANDYKRKGYSIPKRYVDDSKVTDHYAIVPTFYDRQIGLTGLHEQVYNAILKRFLDTMKPPYIYDSYSILYAHKNGELFVSNFNNVIQKGFKTVEDKEEIIPLVKGNIINVPSFTIRNLETKPPKPFTTGTLIMAMEKAGKLIDDEELREQIKTCGIGTSATRAGIIEKLDKKGFINIDKKQKITPTDLGKSVIPIIAKYDESLTSPVKTADMESNLQAVAESKMSVNDYRDMIDTYVRTTTSKILAGSEKPLNTKTKNYPCPCCGKTLKYGRYGWYCDCKFSLGSSICGSKMTEADIDSLVNTGTTTVHNFTSKNGKKFKARLVLDKETKKTNFSFEK